MALTVLGIDTATHACSVALLQGSDVVFEATLMRRQAHAEHLAALIQHVLFHGDVQTSDIDLVCVSKGPGSYTGLRIGVSTAKGIAFASDAALVGVPSLEATAASVKPFASPGDVLVAAFDARRDDVYTAVYSYGDDGTLAEMIPASAMTTHALADTLASMQHRSFWFIGQGASKCLKAWPEDEMNIIRSIRSPGSIGGCDSVFSRR